jgi:signal transduction histidine kinase
MSPFQRHRWFIAAAGIIVSFAGVSLTAHKSLGLTAFADFFGLVVMLGPAAVMLDNAFRRPTQERGFWGLMAFGFALWACNQAAWACSELIQRQPIPDPYFFDIILFFHVVPMIGAVAWRPDLKKEEGRIYLSLLNFLMLLGWWVFLYAFLVFPHQYVVLNVKRYDVLYDRLFLLENTVLLLVLGFGVLTSSRGWKRFYLHFLLASLVYGVNSQFLDRAVVNGSYYSGSLYDVPLIGCVVWMAAAALSARDWDLPVSESKLPPRWRKFIPQLAMLAILSLPVLGLWAARFDHSAPASRVFRIFVVLAAMLLLGAFAFLGQYLQDQALMRLLQESRRGYESQMRLQNQLVQKEKLASLGTLVAGAAREIDHPLNAILSHSEHLWGQERLSSEQNTLLRKIATQAQRTRDLVANLLSFAQQTPGEKALVDLSMLLTRARQMLESRYPGGKIQIDISAAAGLPRVLGNPNQLFQVFVEIIENALDALQEVGGGLLEITAEQRGNEAVLQFSDSGPGIREPQRVFDPFYTTKPVGKGTGLGLSAVYGVIQEHSGQITCQNKPEGGALFILRLPLAESATHVAGAGI